uniref:Selenoprotein P N-terminal domain-containing protein n=1 Tax=Electrophorus electricus TaxID=8005 RepID=A0A4W4H4A0_ELEEL
MWKGPSLLLALALLVGCRAERETGADRCQQPPAWRIGEAWPLRDALGGVTVVAFLLSRLRLMLERSGYTNITYMVVNSQDDKSRRLHPLLQQRLSENITLYSQNPDEPDVWQIANVLKDDFQIYDRCGRLTYHLSLPYTILSQPYVEEAIRNSYCSGMCGDCALEVNRTASRTASVPRLSDNARSRSLLPDTDRGWQRATSGRPDSDAPPPCLTDSRPSKPEPDLLGLANEDDRFKQGHHPPLTPVSLSSALV